MQGRLCIKPAEAVQSAAAVETHFFKCRRQAGVDRYGIIARAEIQQQGRADRRPALFVGAGRIRAARHGNRIAAVTGPDHSLQYAGLMRQCHRVGARAGVDRHFVPE